MIIFVGMCTTLFKTYAILHVRGIAIIVHGTLYMDQQETYYLLSYYLLRINFVPMCVETAV